MAGVRNDALVVHREKPAIDTRNPADGMMCYSGTRVSKKVGVPTCEDIGRALSRIPRFGGHCRTPWSVLNHTVVCSTLSRYYYPADPRTRLAVILHDAHEALTGDIPSPLKVTSMKYLQESLDVRIYNAYFPGGIDAVDEELEARIKFIDGRALVAEAVVVGPPLVTMDNVTMLFGDRPTGAEVAAVHCEVRFLSRSGQEPEWFEQTVVSLRQQLY